MSKYSGMKRAGSSRAISERFAETQKKFIRGVLFLIAITLLIVFVFGDHGLFQLYKLNREILISEKNRLENDLEYIEKLAREKYRMALPGEKVFKVVPKESNKRPNE